MANKIPVNSKALEGTWIPIFEINEKGGRFPRSIMKYHLLDKNLEQSAHAIEVFLKDNPGLSPTFSNIPDQIKQLLHEKTYLTITAGAISLGTERDTPHWCKTEWKDGFTGSAPKEPIKCSKGHVFEKVLLQAWITLHGNKCPFKNRKNNEHEINDTVANLDDLIETDLLNDIDSAKIDAERIQQLADQLRKDQAEVKKLTEEAERQQAHAKTLTDQLERNQAEVKKLTVQAEEQQDKLLELTEKAELLQTNEEIRRRLTELPIISPSTVSNMLEVSSGATKVLIKVGGVATEIVVRETIKAIAKHASLNIAKYTLKYIPFVSIGLGVLFAGYRLYKGITSGDKSEFFKAPLEIISGALALIPLAGIPLSVLLDIGIAGHDIYNLTEKKKAQLVENVSAAYAALGFAENDVPTKEDVDDRFRTIALTLHPDRAADLGEDGARVSNVMMVHLNLCKEKIYKERNW